MAGSMSCQAVLTLLIRGPKRTQVSTARPLRSALPSALLPGQSPAIVARVPAAPTDVVQNGMPTKIRAARVSRTTFTMPVMGLN